MNEILKKLNDRAEYIAETTGDEDCDYANECIAMGLQIAIEIIQSTPIEPTVTINLPSLSAKDMENCKAQLRELFDVKDRYEQTDVTDAIKTRGDIIREISDNIELAQEIFKFCSELFSNYDFSTNGIWAYLNETVEGE